MIDPPISVFVCPISYPTHTYTLSLLISCPLTLQYKGILHSKFNPIFKKNFFFLGADTNRDLDNITDRNTTIKRPSNRLLVFIIQTRHQQSERPVQSRSCPQEQSSIRSSNMVIVLYQQKWNEMTRPNKTHNILCKLARRSSHVFGTSVMITSTPHRTA